MNLVNLKKKYFIVAGCLSIGLTFSPLISQSFAQFAPLPPDGGKDCLKSGMKEADGVAEGSLHVGTSQTDREVNVGPSHADGKKEGSESTVLNSNAKARQINFSGDEMSIEIASREQQ